LCKRGELSAKDTRTKGAFGGKSFTKKSLNRFSNRAEEKKPNHGRQIAFKKEQWGFEKCLRGKA